MKPDVNAVIRAVVDATPNEDTCSAVVRVVTALRADLGHILDVAEDRERRLMRAERERDEMRAERDGAISRLLSADAGIMRERAAFDEMREARDVLLAEVDRLRVRLAEWERGA